MGADSDPRARRNRLRQIASLAFCAVLVLAAIPLSSQAAGAALASGAIGLLALLIVKRARDRSEQARSAARAESYLRGEGAVALALADSDDVFAGLERALGALGEAFGASFGAVWTPDRSGSLSIVSSWRAHGESAPVYEAASSALSLGPGVGLPGRAFMHAEPVWTADLGGASPTRRAAAAREDGLRGGFAIPVNADDEPVAVLELVAGEEFPDSVKLAESLGALRRQLGMFVARQRAESDAVASAENIAAVLEATRDLSRSAHSVDTRSAICQAALKLSGGALVALHEPDPSGRELRPSAVAGKLAHTVADTGLALEGGRTGEVRAYASVSPLFVDSATDDEAVAESLVVTGARSCLYQPVVRDGRAVGVLTLAWSEQLPLLPERTASMLHLLAAEAAVAIERTDLLARLEAVARTDDLTGLGNRRAWDEQLALELARARRAGTPMCVAMLDLDHFKAFNDELGHQAGDRLLKAAASAWRAQLRATDTLTRYGGEEFAVVLPSCNLDDAVGLIERVREVTPAGQTCSCGVASWDGNESPDTMVARADAALYEAKNYGRNRVVVSD